MMNNRVVEKINDSELKEVLQHERVIRKEELEMRKKHLTMEIENAQSELAKIESQLALFNKKDGEKIEL